MNMRMVLNFKKVKELSIVMQFTTITRWWIKGNFYSLMTFVNFEFWLNY